MDDNVTSHEVVDSKYNEILKQTIKGGYNLNPDKIFVKELVKGLIVNKDRYGFEACPCRLVIGSEEKNIDIICPCYYRDDDILEYGCCYCGLYVGEEVSEGKKPVVPIPDRRNSESGSKIVNPDTESVTKQLKYPIFRCNVCGYLCARNSPPEKCPVCGADQKRFDLFLQ